MSPSRGLIGPPDRSILEYPPPRFVRYSKSRTKKTYALPLRITVTGILPAIMAVKRSQPCWHQTIKNSLIRQQLDTCDNTVNSYLPPGK